MKTVIRKIGNSEGVILPKEMLEKLNLKAGDSVALVEHEGSLSLVPTFTTLDEQLESAREGMARYRVALRELAK